MKTSFFILSDVFIYYLLFATFREKSNTTKWLVNKRKFIVASLFIICLFPFFSGDYFHYEQIYNNLLKGDSSGMEDVYLILAKITYNYFIFRLVVWGGALSLFFYSVKLSKLPFEYVSLFFVALYLLLFSYARVSLSMAMMFLGLTMISYNAMVSFKAILSRFFYIIIGLTLIAVSYYFHKSSVFGIACICVSLITYKMTKFRMLIMILAIPVIVQLIQYLIVDLLNADAFDNESLINVRAAQKYISDEGGSKSFNLGVGIQNLLVRTSFYLIAYIYIKALWENTYRLFPKPIKIISTTAFLCVVGASIFAFNLGYNTWTLYYRFLNYAMIPSTFFLVYCLIHNVYPKIVKMTLTIGWIASFYTLFYSLYCAHVGEIG